MKIETLEQGCFYHIYNRGINGTDIFKETDNYKYFLRLYERYIDPIAQTYAWCLLGNHFHILLYIKNLDEVDVSKLTYTTTDKPKQLDPSRQFAHLFNAYCLSFNKRYKRTGSLFEKPFKRKCVGNVAYFKELVFYIHNNPVHHDFCERLQDYPWSSYGTIISLKPTKMERDNLIGFFDTTGNFVDYHKQKHELKCIENLIIE